VSIARSPFIRSTASDDDDDDGGDDGSGGLNSHSHVGSQALSDDRHVDATILNDGACWG